MQISMVRSCSHIALLQTREIDPLPSLSTNYNTTVDMVWWDRFVFFLPPTVQRHVAESAPIVPDWYSRFQPWSRSLIKSVCRVPRVGFHFAVKIVENALFDFWPWLTKHRQINRSSDSGVWGWRGVGEESHLHLFLWARRLEKPGGHLVVKVWSFLYLRVLGGRD